MDANHLAPGTLRSRIPTILLTLAALALSGAGGARAQSDVWVPEIPLTRDSGTHARALGMGGAYLALSDDCGALRYNPAGLARVQRVEFCGSLIDADRKTENTFHGRTAREKLARTRVSALGFAYPFPTYRGSMVIALGFHVPWLLDREYSREGSWEGELLEEEIFEEGSVGEWSFAYAVDVTPTLSLGARASWIRGTRFQDWLFVRDGSVGLPDYHDVNDVDMSGYTGSVGALARVGRRGRLGLVIDLPRWIHLDGTLQDLAEGVEYVYTEDMTLPFSVGFGGAVNWERLLVAADARFTDWTQIDYEGPLRYWDVTGRRRLAYARTWDLHLGAEYLLDLGRTAGLRLRAGYAREPVPYRILFEDVALGTDDRVQPVYYDADFDPDRDFFTLGVGVLIEQSITVDAAFATGSFRRSGQDLTEELRENRLLLTTAFRLQ